MTRSSNCTSKGWYSIFSIIKALYPCLLLALEYKACLAGSLGQSFDSADVSETTAIEYDLSDPFLFGAVRHQLTHQFGLFGFGQALGFLTKFVIDGRCRCQGIPSRVIDHLAINLCQTAEYIKPRPGACAFNCLSHALVPVNSCFTTCLFSHKPSPTFWCLCSYRICQPCGGSFRPNNGYPYLYKAQADVFFGYPQLPAPPALYQIR